MDLVREMKSISSRLARVIYPSDVLFRRVLPQSHFQVYIPLCRSCPTLPSHDFVRETHAYTFLKPFNSFCSWFADGIYTLTPSGEYLYGRKRNRSTAEWDRTVTCRHGSVTGPRDVG